MDLKDHSEKAMEIKESEDHKGWTEYQDLRETLEETDYQDL